jgi:UDP-3-O-[3-hydroxymyristoyl] glucosamine N-acyltransferase
MTLADLAQHLHAELTPGDTQTLADISTREITGVSGIETAGPTHITFVANPKYTSLARTTQAAALIVEPTFPTLATPTLRIANPYLAWSKAVALFNPAPTYAPGIHPTAVIGPEVTLGEGVSIQPYAVIEAGAAIGAGSIIGAHGFIGQGSTLGPGCQLYPHVTIRERALIGARVVIHSGTVIGSDGFGYEFSGGRHVKIPQTGIVQIDDDVEIGANVTIDRARFGRTWIQEGTKIDNLVQIAHNVVIGRHSIIVAQAGISGSSKLGQYVTLAGQVGVAGHIEIGDRVTVAAQSGISKNIPAGEVWFGYPAGPMREYKERLAYINRLDKLNARVRKLEQELDAKGKSSNPET